MLTTTLSFANLHNHGELFANMLRARRELFIVHNKWNLPEAMGMEYDQYEGSGRQPPDANHHPLRDLQLHDPRRPARVVGHHSRPSLA